LSPTGLSNCRSTDNIFVERLWRNVKHEDVYLKGYGSMVELTLGLTKYFAFYNGERPHQSLGYETPDTVYRTALGGGAVIVDKFGGAAEAPPRFATLHGGCLRRRQKSRSNSTDKTWAAPSSCS